jgi:aminopeptidase N
MCVFSFSLFSLVRGSGLTYGKGASLLKQLVFVVGMDGFKTGMRYYFKKFAWGALK